MLVALGEICSIEAVLVNPTLPIHSHLLHIGGANIVSNRGALVGLRTASEEELVSPKFLFSEEDVLYSKIRPYLRKVAVPRMRALCSADIYPLRPKQDRVLPEYLQYLLLSDAFTSYAVRVSNRAGMPKVNREQLFAYQCELPTLLDQARRVSYLQSAMERLDELERLEKDRRDELWAMKRSLVFGASRDSYPRVRLSEVAQWAREPEEVSVSKTYAFAGVKSFGRGLFASATRRGGEFSYKSVQRLRAGDFVFPKLMAWEGALAMIPKKFEGLVVSPEFVVFRLGAAELIPEVLDVYFRSPSTWPLVHAASTGTNRRRRRLYPKPFLELEVPLPPIGAQRQLRRVYEVEVAAREFWAEGDADIEQLRSGVMARVFQQ